MVFDIKGYDHNLQIINQNNEKIALFRVKISNDPESRSKGLMFVKDLPQNYGMLFEFEKEQIINMWMKNTPLSLDMIFIDKNNRIIKIEPQTKPFSTEIISSGNKITKVLEINAKLVESLGIKIGNKIKLF